jgi:REP element-mobilizing transposase RayT
MGHTFCNCLFHVVFSTKERKAYPIENMQHLHSYMVGIARKNEFNILIAGGAPDHVHLLLALPTSIPVAKGVQLLKGGSSKWFNEEYPNSDFAWQQGFAVFTVSQSQIDAVAGYIRNQEQHHKKRDFRAEFIALLEKNGVTYDPRFVLGLMRRAATLGIRGLLTPRLKPGAVLGWHLRRQNLVTTFTQ